MRRLPGSQSRPSDSATVFGRGAAEATVGGAEGGGPATAGRGSATLVLAEESGKEGVVIRRPEPATVSIGSTVSWASMAESCCSYSASRASTSSGFHRGMMVGCGSDSHQPFQADGVSMRTV